MSPPAPVSKPITRLYRTPAGKEIFREELRALGPDASAAVARAIQRRAKGVQLPREDEYIRGRIRAIRVTYDGGEYRVLYASTGRDRHVLLCLVAITKKRGKTPPTAIEAAERRLADWESRGSGSRESE